MWNKIYDKYLIAREELLKPTYERIYDGHDVLIEEKIIGEKDEDDLICIRVSLFKDNHWQGDCEILPQIRSLTFEKKYNKINKQNYFDWFLVKEYNDFSIYLSQNEKYIMICNEIGGKVMCTSVYNIEEITE